MLTTVREQLGDSLYSLFTKWGKYQFLLMTVPGKKMLVMASTFEIPWSNGK